MRQICQYDSAQFHISFAFKLNVGEIQDFDNVNNFLVWQMLREFSAAVLWLW